MVRILYPEKRMVSEETIIGWAQDEIVNNAWRMNPELDLVEIQSRYEYKNIDLREAMFILDDCGAVTFAIDY